MIIPISKSKVKSFEKIIWGTDESGNSSRTISWDHFNHDGTQKTAVQDYTVRVQQTAHGDDNISNCRAELLRGLVKSRVKPVYAEGQAADLAGIIAETFVDFAVQINPGTRVGIFLENKHR